MRSSKEIDKVTPKTPPTHKKQPETASPSHEVRRYASWRRAPVKQVGHLFLDSPPQSKCPFCVIEIDQRFFDLYGRLMKFGTEKALCATHTQRPLPEVAEERGYPIIEWESLSGRLTTFNDTIAKVIREGVPPRYKDKYEEYRKIEVPHIRTWKQIDLNVAGYYGPRGAAIMMDHISTTFTPALREVAESRDVPDFISVILVPELTVFLIMDDMQVDEKKARWVLKDSAMFGEAYGAIE